MMNLREQFLEVMNFNPDVPALKWEFGYWGETLNKWYAAGLPKKNYPSLPGAITTPTSSLYVAAWNCKKRTTLPVGIAVTGGGLYSPTQGFPYDRDVRDYFKMDHQQVVVDVNLLFEPMIDVQVLFEDEKTFSYIDIDGVRRHFLKNEETLPTAMEWPIKDKTSWEKLKSERLRLDDISRRFPANWLELVELYKNRDYPLALGGYPQGLFGTPSHLLGYENLFSWYYSQPELVHDILNTFTEVWLAVFAEVLTQVEVDHFHFWEDISFGKGPMVSLDIVREFMLPYYKRIIDFLKAHGVKVFLVDTDGDCNSLIPLFLEAGVTGMYPFETHCGMDIVKVRQQYPGLQMLGGVPKYDIAKGKDAIDGFLGNVEKVLKTGGYIPFADHLVLPDVSWENFSYYRSQLNDRIDRCAMAAI